MTTRVLIHSSLLSLLLLFCANSGAAQNVAARSTSRYAQPLTMYELEHDGHTRSIGLYVPSKYNANQPAPLIIALHGRYSSPQAFHAFSRLDAIAETRGAILVYPEKLAGAWNDGAHQLLNRPGAPEDDQGFIRAAIEAVRGDYSIDTASIMLVGYDSGGAMAYSLACQPNAGYAGVVSVGPLLFEYTRAACSAASPTPLLILHGRRDEFAPSGGGDTSVRGERAPLPAAARLGVEETLAAWRGVNGCNSEPSARGRNQSVFYRSCSAGAALAYIGVGGGVRDWFHSGAGYELNEQGVSATALLDGFLFDRARFALPQSNSRGRARSWIVYAPPNYDPARAYPVVVVLHGRPSNAGSMAAISDMNTTGRREGFIVVYPEGLDNEWNAQFDISASDISLTGRRSTLPQDDVGFLKTLMRDLRQDFNVDTRRMYLTGFSNGAFMTYRMACSASDTFAAFAAVSAALYVELSRYCQRSPATAMLLMNGTADPSVPYEGVEVPNSEGGEPIRITLSVQETVAAFARRNHCSLRGTSTTFAERGRSPGTNVVRFTPHDCDANAEIVFYLINGGGHTWPGVTGIILEEYFGSTNMDINASDTIWDFFSRHSLQLSD